VTTAGVSLLDARYRSGAAISQLFDRTLERLAQTPGIESAALVLGLPYERLLNIGFQFVDVPQREGRLTNASYVAGDLFATLRIPVLRGRGLLAADAADAPAVVVVNESFQRLYSTERDAIGRRIRLSGAEREIVGVVGNVQAQSSFAIDGAVPGPLTSLPLIYVPAAQSAQSLRGVHIWFSPSWVVRARSPRDAALAIRQAITSVDPLLPVGEPIQMTEVMARATAQPRLLMTLVGVLAGAALLLAAIGLNGLFMLVVTERGREMAVRLAVGATPGGLVRLVIRDAGRLLASGLVLGVGLTAAADRALRGLWSGMSPLDPSSVGIAALTLACVSVMAVAAPALRAARVAPMDVLRAE
jgi:hypothetical protein